MRTPIRAFRLCDAQVGCANDSSLPRILPLTDGGAMIIDAHVAVDLERYPVERVLELLAGAKIGSAVIFAHSRARDIDRHNVYVLEAARRHDLYPFYYLGGNPFGDTRPDELLVPDNLSDYAGIRWH